MQAVGVRREAEVTTVYALVRAACVLEALAGDRKGQYSIRATDLFRPLFSLDYRGAHRHRDCGLPLEVIEACSKNGMRPVHPAEVLQEDFLKPLGMGANALAKALHVPTPRINDVVRKLRGVSADTAMRLARYFGGDARSWLNLQTAYDLRIAEISNAKRIVREVSPSRAVGAS
jgi:antitoxin HigA-1